MNFVNGTAETFKEIFGEEGLNYAQNKLACWKAELPYYPEQGVRIIFAKKGDYPEIDCHPAQAFVSRVNPEDNSVTYNKEHPLGLVIYPEVMAVQHSGQGFSEYVMNTGTLIHELTHIKQVSEGRLDSHSFLEITWEGERIEIVMDGYLAYPWEKEACMAQLGYILAGRPDLIERAYLHMVECSRGLKY